jgi:D-alanyl-D-alanine carboxypeptidase/D-alanyl-D-alanine endopeptidase (penicillin-binding protein 7)
MSSDNRAASALARTYPGGKAAFLGAVKEKLNALDMHHTFIEEPTGLSPSNRSTAADVAKMAAAASSYPEITRITTDAGEAIDMNGRAVQYHNTNRLVGKQGWDILLSKTGFTREAGRCLVMRMQSAGKHVIVVLLNAAGGAQRMLDAENVRRYLSGETMLASMTPHARTHKTRLASSHAGSRKARASKGVVLVKTKVASSARRKGSST